jgi:hypothetical protein
VNDGAGTFTIGRVAPGSYDLLVTAPDGRVARAGAVVIRAGEQKSGLALVLRPGVTLRGRAFDVESAAPVAGARVVILGTREHVHAVTDAAGIFALPGQIPGRTLLVSIQGTREYVPAQREIAVPDDRVELQLRPFRLLPFRALPDGLLSDPGQDADVGLQLAEREDGPAVERVVPGSSAARLGLKPGERLLAVAGRDVRPLDGLATALLLRGPPGSTVELTVASPGGGARTLALERAKLPPSR